MKLKTISFPESSFPLTSGRKTRALGATISGMRSETGWAEFGYFLCYFKMIAPRALVFRPLVKGNEDSKQLAFSFAHALNWMIDSSTKRFKRLAHEVLKRAQSQLNSSKS